MNIPKPFWADAVFTTCFLINHMPLSVLHGEIPYKIFFPNKSLFPVDSRIFGSTCFVRDVCSHVTNLDPKFLKCIFLGYSRLQKGYKYYCPSLNKYLVSIDVTFTENTPYFSSPPSPAHQGEDDDLLVYSITSSEPVSALAPVKTPIVQVYSRHKPLDSCHAPVSSSSNLVLSNDLPIALRKGKCHCTYPISSFVSYNCLSFSSCSFIASLDSIFIPKIVHEPYLILVSIMQ